MGCDGACCARPAGVAEGTHALCANDSYAGPSCKLATTSTATHTANTRDDRRRIRFHSAGTRDGADSAGCSATCLMASYGTYRNRPESTVQNALRCRRKITDASHTGAAYRWYMAPSID